MQSCVYLRTLQSLQKCLVSPLRGRRSYKMELRTILYAHVCGFIREIVASLNLILVYLSLSVNFLGLSFD